MLVTNRAASCISLTFTTTPTQYTYDGKTWSLCYDVGQPTPLPTVVPSVVPSLKPTTSPTLIPTASPSLTPTITPTLVPSKAPTTAPTGISYYYYILH